MEISTVEFQKKETENGYVKIKVDDIWILEHKFVVEEFIGRKLRPEERIHHIDFCKKNNSIYNLMIFPNDKEHLKFHTKLKQHGLTRPLLNQIKNRWNEYDSELP